MNCNLIGYIEFACDGCEQNNCRYIVPDDDFEDLLKEKKGTDEQDMSRICDVENCGVCKANMPALNETKLNAKAIREEEKAYAIKCDDLGFIDKHCGRCYIEPCPTVEVSDTIAKINGLKPKLPELKRESQLLDSITASHKQQFNIARKKSADYSRGDDEYRNFETVNRVLPWITTEEGIIIRMVDKLTRLANLAHYGNSYVTDESFEDTCDDLANYANILKAYRQHKRIYEIKKEEDVISTTPLA